MKYLLSLGIFVGITAIIILSASLILKKGLSSGSNIALANQILHDNRRSPSIAETQVTANDVPAQVLGIETLVDETRPEASPTPEVGSRSLVDYLRSHGQEYSFTYRKQLAQVYNLGPYTGSIQQNDKLLELLKNTDRE